VKKKGGFYLFISWLVPGLGHYMQGRKKDGVILFFSIMYFFVLGLLLGGRFVGTNEGSPLTIFLTFAQFGNGILYFMGKFLGLGSQVKATWTSDYGTFFLMGGGLINYLAAVRAYEISEGIKR